MARSGYCLGCHGGLAQLGERGVRNAEVEGSNPLPSTIFILAASRPRLRGRVGRRRATHSPTFPDQAPRFTLRAIGGGGDVFGRTGTGGFGGGASIFCEARFRIVW